MTAINRDNYELWLSGWLEGKLDENRTEQLMAFLFENPDILEETDTLTAMKLIPGKDLYNGRKKLMRNPSQLSRGQIEYLSAAFHEKDLSTDQISELKQNLENNDESRRIFNSTGKARLVPPDIRYSKKGSLKRLTPGQKIFRLATEVTGIAAAITILVINFMIPGSYLKNEKDAVSEQVQSQDTSREIIIYRQIPILVPSGPKVSGTKKVTSDLQPDIHAVLARAESQTNEQIVINPDSGPNEEIRNPAGEITQVTFTSSATHLEFDAFNHSLMASTISYDPDFYNDNRGRIRKFIAGTFREKILNEERYSEQPIKPYEVARAGVNGLNRLLDWNMDLKQTTDEDGEIKSIYFSSMLLTFNAPVKKTDE